MSKQTVYILVAMGLFVVAPIIIFSKMTAKDVAVEPGKYDELAQCLTDKGTKMYGAYWCSYCKTQKAAFGTSFEKVNYIECSLPGGQGQTDECIEAKIEGYPTWEFPDGSRGSGDIALEVLAEKSDCEFIK